MESLCCTNFLIHRYYYLYLISVYLYLCGLICHPVWPTVQFFSNFAHGCDAISLLWVFLVVLLFGVGLGVNISADWGVYFGAVVWKVVICKSWGDVCGLGSSCWLGSTLRLSSPKFKTHDQMYMMPTEVSEFSVNERKNNFKKVTYPIVYFL